MSTALRRVVEYAIVCTVEESAFARFKPKHDIRAARNSEGALDQGSARRWYWLLIIPFVALLCPVYLRTAPTIAGIPFFYWYQFVWLVLSALITGIVYMLVRETEP